jgi:transposase
MKAYSIDLRERIVAAAARGMPKTEIAATFKVSRSTVTRLIARRRRDEHDTLAATPPPGRLRTLPSSQHLALWAQLEANPDATIEAHTRLWNTTHGTALSQWTVGRAIRRLGWTRKKSRWAPPNGTKQPGTRTETG